MGLPKAILTKDNWHIVHRDESLRLNVQTGEKKLHSLEPYYQTGEIKKVFYKLQVRQHPSYCWYFSDEVSKFSL